MCRFFETVFQKEGTKFKSSQPWSSLVILGLAYFTWLLWVYSGGERNSMYAICMEGRKEGNRSSPHGYEMQRAQHPGLIQPHTCSAKTARWRLSVKLCVRQWLGGGASSLILCPWNSTHPPTSLASLSRKIVPRSSSSLQPTLPSRPLLKLVSMQDSLQLLIGMIWYV